MLYSDIFLTLFWRSQRSQNMQDFCMCQVLLLSSTTHPLTKSYPLLELCHGLFKQLHNDFIDQRKCITYPGKINDSSWHLPLFLDNFLLSTLLFPCPPGYNQVLCCFLSQWHLISSFLRPIARQNPCSAPSFPCLQTPLALLIFLPPQWSSFLSLCFALTLPPTLPI